MGDVKKNARWIGEQSGLDPEGLILDTAVACRWDRIKPGATLVDRDERESKVKAAVLDPPPDILELANRYFSGSLRLARVLAAMKAQADLNAPAPFFITTRKMHELLILAEGDKSKAPCREHVARMMLYIYCSGIVRVVKPGHAREAPRLQWIGAKGTKSPPDPNEPIILKQSPKPKAPAPQYPTPVDGFTRPADVLKGNGGGKVTPEQIADFRRVISDQGGPGGVWERKLDSEAPGWRTRSIEEKTEIYFRLMKQRR